MSGSNFLPNLLLPKPALRESRKMGQIIVFLKDECAATAIEHGVIAAGMAVAITPVITGVGTRLKTTFTAAQTALK